MWIKISDRELVNMDRVVAITTYTHSDPAKQSMTFWFSKPGDANHGDFIDASHIPDEIKGMLGMETT